MSSEMLVIELIGIVYKNQNLHLDGSLPFAGSLDPVLSSEQGKARPILVIQIKKLQFA